MRVLPADAAVTGIEPYEAIEALLLVLVPLEPCCGCFERPLRFRCGRPWLAAASWLLTNSPRLPPCGACPVDDDGTHGFVK
jgi:hypothetical protein